MSRLSLQQIVDMFSCQEVTQPTPDYPSSQDDDDEMSSPHVVLPGPGIISYLDDVLFRVEKPLNHDVNEVGKGRELNSAATLASRHVAGHSPSFIIIIVIMTLGWGLLWGLAAESCGRIWLPCLINLVDQAHSQGVQRTLPYQPKGLLFAIEWV